MALAKKRSLQQARIASSFPHDVLHRPQLYKGYNFDHPYFKQGIENIVTMIQESVNKSETGTLIKATAEVL